MKLEPANFFETSTASYQLTRRHVVEECNVYYSNICQESITDNLTSIVRSGFTPSGIFGGRSESGSGSSGLLVDEVRVGQALRDFWWTN